MSQQSDILQQILRSIQMLIQQNPAQQGPDWRSYNGFSGMQSNSTMYSGIQGMVSSLLGPTIGGLVNKYVLGNQFNRYGGLSGNLSGILMPTNGGTYTGAFLNTLQQSRQTQQYWTRAQQRQALSRDFAGRYFDTVYPRGADQTQQDWQAERAAFLRNAQDNAVSAPILLSTFLDPTQITRTLRGIQSAQAGVAQWGARRNPLDTNINRRSDAMARAVRSMAIQSLDAAQGRARDAQGNDISYGGFSSGAVAQLAGMLSNASDVLGNTNDIKSAVDNFKERVRSTTQALMPLRDIFGNDLNGMINMLQNVTGQSISQLSSGTINAISTRMADMARYAPGVSTGQVAAMGDSMRKMLANNGVRGLTGIGAAGLGSYAASFLVPGNGAYGVNQQEYQAGVLNSLASAQGSQGVDYMSMAYALAVNRNKYKGSVQDFANDIAGAGGDPITAAMRLAGVSNRGQLLQGMGYSQYSQGLSSGAFAPVAMQQQWKQAARIKQLSTTMAAESLGISGQDVSSAMNKLNDPAILSQFSRDGNADNIQGLTDGQRRALNSMKSDSDFMAKMRQGSQIQQTRRYQQAVGQVRKVMRDVDSTGTKGWLQFLAAFTGNKENAQGNQILAKVDQGTRAAIGFQLYGQNAAEAVKVRNARLVEAFGTDANQILYQGLMGKASGSQKYKQMLRVATGKVSDNDVQGQMKQKKAEQYLRSYTALGGDQKLLDSALKNVTQGSAYADFQADMDKAAKQESPTARLKAQTQAKKRFRQRATALSSLQKLQSSDLDATTKTQVEELLKAQAKGQKLQFKQGGITQQRYKEIKRGLSGPAAAMDLNSVMNKLSATLQEILNWLRQSHKQEKK